MSCKGFCGCAVQLNLKLLCGTDPRRIGASRSNAGWTRRYACRSQICMLECDVGARIAFHETIISSPSCFALTTTNEAKMAQKCVHKGCEKVFSDPDEPCTYHPGTPAPKCLNILQTPALADCSIKGPPVFHEGQKGWSASLLLYGIQIKLLTRSSGWKCCKPRVLTFDEFMEIPPCTTGKHSTVDDTPAPEPKPNNADVDAKIRAENERAQNLPPPVARVAVAAQPPKATPSPAPPEDEDDDPDIPIPDGATCKRRGCGAVYKAGQDRSTEECVHHPGQALFHEGSKGWTCCKRRVLEFDEFMKLPGCTTKPQHLFVGKKKDPTSEEELKDVRNDFYQTASTVIASLYLKKIDKTRSTIEFPDPTTVELDLHTQDQKRYRSRMVLFGATKPGENLAKVMGTKLELTLAKADGLGWPVLRADDPHTGEIIQAGRAGRV